MAGLAPIFITVYNRLEHLIQCVESLKTNIDAKNSVLYISSDAPSKKEDEVIIDKIREYILTIDGFKKIVPVFHEKNQGSFKAIEITREVIFKNFDKYIFLEDDIIVSEFFLDYLNKSLEFYSSNTNIFSVSAFSPVVFYEGKKRRYVKDGGYFFTRRFNPWGFGVWKDKIINSNTYSIEEIRRDLMNWKFTIKFNGIGIDLPRSLYRYVRKNQLPSPDYLFCYHMVKNNLYTLVPYKTLSKNMGFDGSGLNCTEDEYLQRLSMSAFPKNLSSDLPNFSTSYINDKIEFNRQLSVQNVVKAGQFMVKALLS